MLFVTASAAVVVMLSNGLIKIEFPKAMPCWTFAVEPVAANPASVDSRISVDDAIRAEEIVAEFHPGVKELDPVKL